MFDPDNIKIMLYVSYAFGFIGAWMFYSVLSTARQLVTLRRTDRDRLHQAGTDALQTVAAEIAAETKGGG